MRTNRHRQILIALALVCACILVWTEASGITRITVSSVPGLVSSSITGGTDIEDASGGNTEYGALDVRIAYTVRGKSYVLHTQWLDDFWSSNDQFASLTTRLARGRTIGVLYLSFAPQVARPDVPVSWGVPLATIIGGAILVAYLGARRLGRRKES